MKVCDNCKASGQLFNVELKSGDKKKTVTLCYDCLKKLIDGLNKANKEAKK